MTIFVFDMAFACGQEHNIRRISAPTTPTAAGDDPFEKARQEQDEIMAAAEASRKDWKERERVSVAIEIQMRLWL